LPDFYTFERKLICSHRDFDKFLAALSAGRKCAIVSGLNPSGMLHLGHKVVFDTCLYFQQKYRVPVFVPLSDDESYVAGKVPDLKSARENAFKLAKQLLAYGFDPKLTKFIIDSECPQIFLFAMELSKKLTLSEVKATFGYTDSTNPGLAFYTCVQAAHVLLPFKLGYEAVLVPIGPDEDAHLRLCRDIAARAGYPKPAVTHTSFLPRIDGRKMSKSKGNAIFLLEDEQTIRRKIRRAFSGGAPTAELHRKFGGDPEKDVACIYLTKLFLSDQQAAQLIADYRSGKLLSSDLKKMLTKYVLELSRKLKKNLENVELTNSLFSAFDLFNSN